MTRLARIQPSHQIVPLDLVAPGARGLNTVQAGQLMDQKYCTIALNAVIDTAGRLAARQGTTNQTLTPVGNVSITNEVVGTGTGAQTIFSGFLANANDIASTITFTAGAVVGTDNGLGQITGGGIVSGSINYATGSWTITYVAAVGNGTNITANYTYTPQIKEIFEYNAGNNVFQTLVTWNGGAANSITNPPGNSIAGTASLASGTWFFGNFNNKVIGFQAGQKPCVYSTGTPQLNTIVESSGTWPLSSGVGCTAFGRVWSVSQSDNQTITYCDLLNETAVGTAGAGVINMANVWSNGTDTVTAIFAFNASLVVCGNRHIVFFTDGRGSTIGLDPTQAYVFDTITGTGVISQWTVAPVGASDIVFLGPNGVQSLLRLTQGSRDNPTIDLSKFTRDTLLAQVNNETPNTIQATYNPLTGFYILNLMKSGTVWCLDQRRRYQDETGNLCAIITTWGMTATALATNHSNISLIARTAGKVAIYSGTQDEGTSYQFQYLSPWMNFAQQGGQQISVRLKMLKRLRGLVYTGGGSLELTWATDFGTGDLSGAGSTTLLLAPKGTSSQYGIGQYGVSLYGGGAATAVVNYAARARGQYYQFGMSMTINQVFALQQLQATMKIGRVAGGLIG